MSLTHIHNKEVWTRPFDSPAGQLEEIIRFAIAFLLSGSISYHFISVFAGAVDGVKALFKYSFHLIARCSPIGSVGQKANISSSTAFFRNIFTMITSLELKIRGNGAK